MYFHFTLLIGFLLACAVLADCHREHRQSRSTSDGPQYSAEWAGAVLEDKNGTFRSITGTFNLPILSGTPFSTASAWAGIGCVTSNSAVRAGVKFDVTTEGVFLMPWCQWYPGEPDYFPDLLMIAGDPIHVIVSVLSATSAVVWLENLRSGQFVHAELDSTYPICGERAEWLIEDPKLNGQTVPLADFGEVTFTDTIATNRKGMYKLDEASIFDIKQNNQVLASTSIINETSFLIKYV